MNRRRSVLVALAVTGGFTALAIPYFVFDGSPSFRPEPVVFYFRFPEIPGVQVGTSILHNATKVGKVVAIKAAESVTDSSPPLDTLGVPGFVLVVELDPSHNYREFEIPVIRLSHQDETVVVIERDQNEIVDPQSRYWQAGETIVGMVSVHPT